MSRSYHGDRYLKQKYGSNWQWWKQEPKEWRRLYKHKKRRAAWRHCRARINNGADLDDMVYPKDKQPWIYCW